MHRLTITISFILLTILFCSAQDKQKITVKANWKIGETKEMIQLKTHSWTETDEYDFSAPDTIAIYSINVINKLNSGYFVKWEVVNVLGVYEDIEMFDFMTFYLNNFKYVVETDSNGNFVELKNWNYLIKLNNYFKNQTIALAIKEGLSRNEINDIYSETPLAETKEELIEMCQNLTSIFHALYGEEFLINDTVVEYKRMDNPNIPEGIPYFQKVIASPLENKNISIKYIVESDYVEELKLLKKYYPDQDDYGEGKSINYSEYIYNPNSGWIEKITIYFEMDDEYGKNATIIDYIFE